MKHIALLLWAVALSLFMYELGSATAWKQAKQLLIQTRPTIETRLIEEYFYCTQDRKILGQFAAKHTK